MCLRTRPCSCFCFVAHCWKKKRGARPGQNPDSLGTASILRPLKGLCEKINLHFKFFLMIMGDEAFQTKKNEPTHISLRCLEQAVCCIMYCNSGPNFPRSPADMTYRWRWMRHLTLNASCITMKPRWLSGLVNSWRVCPRGLLSSDTLLWSPGDCLEVRGWIGKQR